MDSQIRFARKIPGARCIRCRNACLPIDGVTLFRQALTRIQDTAHIKTKNFHWHMSGRHFRDYHLLLDEHGDQIFVMTEVIAERARKLGEATIHSIGDKSRHQRLKDNDSEVMAPQSMLAELCEDNQQLTQSLRSTHELCDRYNDVATASLIETWIDETEQRVWFLSEIQTGARR
jgi:starvation-inducible DNA-binding protein